MRCWSCKRIIVIPDRVVNTGTEYPLSDTVDAVCGSCGDIYAITTVKKPGRMVKVDRDSEAEAERRRGWRD